MIFEIVIELAYLEQGYLTNSIKSAKNANRQLQAMRDMYGIDDEFLHVIGDAEHVRGIHFNVARLGSYIFLHMYRKKLLEVTNFIMAVHFEAKWYSFDIGIL